MMTVEIANALITESALSDIQLRAAVEHFAALSDMMLNSGPLFSGTRRQAVEMHNRAVRRLNASAEQKREAERKAALQAEQLMEIEP